MKGLQLRVSANGAKIWRLRSTATGTVTIGDFPEMSLAEARETAMGMVASAKRQRRVLATAGGVAPQVDRRTLATLLDDFEKAKGARLRSWYLQRRAIEQRYAAQLKKPALQLDEKTVRLPVEMERSVAAKRSAVYLSGVLRWAGIGRPVKQGDLNDLVPESPRARILERAEIRALLAMTDSLVADYTETLLRTAQRRGDVAAMRWDALELNEGIWRFAMQKSRSRTPVELPLSDAVLKLLERRKKTRVGPYVFSTGGEPMSNFDRLLRQAHDQVGSTDWTLHDLRRTARTCMGRAGVRPDIAERCLGHTVGNAIERTYDRYSYVSEMKKAFNDLSRHLDALAAENVVILGRA